MPRKSDAGPIPGTGLPPETKDGVSIEDNVLPKSIVTRLAKGVLPQNTNIQKDATLALTKGATVFINYLCAAANQHAAKNNRKTISPKDILEAISELELDEFRPRLEAELAKFEEISSEKRAASKKAAKDKEAAKAAEESPGKTSPVHGSDANEEEEGGDEEGIGSPPPAKKRKANGKATSANGTPASSKSKKAIGTMAKKAVVVPLDEDEDNEDEELDEDKEAQDYEEDEGEDENSTLHQAAIEDDVVEDIDDQELVEEDEALDNGDDSD